MLASELSEPAHLLQKFQQFNFGSHHSIGALLPQFTCQKVHAKAAWPFTFLTDDKMDDALESIILARSFVVFFEDEDEDEDEDEGGFQCCSYASKGNPAWQSKELLISLPRR